MSDANFYQVLGVARSAGADEIRSAYRELVKKHHPDLFTATLDKAEATEKLRQINEAYAVLGNAKRRQRYDQELVQKSQTRPRAPSAAKRPRPSGPRRQAEPRRKTAKIPKVRLHFSKKWAGYSLAAATGILVLIYAGQSVPRLITAWTLVEKLEVSPRKDVSPSEGARQDWVPVGHYASVSECVGILKERVRKDEQEGSRAVFGEPNGTMAITVFVKQETTAPAANESALKSESPITERGPESPKNGMIKRVRSLECRATQRFETESRLRSTLRRVGLPL